MVRNLDHYKIVAMDESTAPRPGKSVRGSTTGQPIMATFDLLGRRWSIAVLWQLRAGPIGFRDLRRVLPGISTGVLSTRLREFVAVEVATTDSVGKYTLTRLGMELLYSLAPLHAWSHNWARQLGIEVPPGADDPLL